MFRSIILYCVSHFHVVSAISCMCQSFHAVSVISMLYQPFRFVLVILLFYQPFFVDIFFSFFVVCVVGLLP
jgi:hypothetical protein